MILKLQQGGNALPPLVSYQPVTVTGGATAGASTAPSNDQETTDLTDLANQITANTSVTASIS